MTEKQVLPLKLNNLKYITKANFSNTYITLLIHFKAAQILQTTSYFITCLSVFERLLVISYSLMNKFASENFSQGFSKLTSFSITWLEFIFSTQDSLPSSVWSTRNNMHTYFVFSISNLKSKLLLLCWQLGSIYSKQVSSSILTTKKWL